MNLLERLVVFPHSACHWRLRRRRFRPPDDSGEPGSFYCSRWRRSTTLLLVVRGGTTTTPTISYRRASYLLRSSRGRRIRWSWLVFASDSRSTRPRRDWSQAHWVAWPVWCSGCVVQLQAAHILLWHTAVVPLSAVLGAMMGSKESSSSRSCQTRLGFRHPAPEAYFPAIAIS